MGHAVGLFGLFLEQYPLQAHHVVLIDYRWLSIFHSPAGRGIGHQIMCEQGYAFPATVTVASDSHSNMYGGLGCLGTPVRSFQVYVSFFEPE